MKLWHYEFARRENEFTRFSKAAVVASFLGVAAWAMLNVWRGKVYHGEYFWISILGLFLFVIAKLPVIRQRIWISFGTHQMSANMANVYRFGYWLMAVGFLLTFVP